MTDKNKSAGVLSSSDPEQLRRVALNYGIQNGSRWRPFTNRERFAAAWSASSGTIFSVLVAVLVAVSFVAEALGHDPAYDRGAAMAVVGVCLGRFVFAARLHYVKLEEDEGHRLLRDLRANIDHGTPIPKR